MTCEFYYFLLVNFVLISAITKRKQVCAEVCQVIEVGCILT